MTIRNTAGSQDIESDTENLYDDDAWNFFEGDLGNNSDINDEDLDFFDGEDEVIRASSNRTRHSRVR